MSGDTIRSLAEEQQQDVRLYHAELMTARDVIDRAGLRAVKIRNLLNAAKATPSWEWPSPGVAICLIPDPCDTSLPEAGEATT